MFRIRRLILKLTVAAAIIPVVFCAFILLLPAIGKMIGTRPIGSRYFIQYSDTEYDTVRFYRDGYPITAIDHIESQASALIALYGLFCLAVASVEGFIRLVERNKRRTGGFEVITHPSSAEGGAPSPARPESAA